jgi:hypothetical protein
MYFSIIAKVIIAQYLIYSIYNYVCNSKVKMIMNIETILKYTMSIDNETILIDLTLIQVHKNL